MNYTIQQRLNICLTLVIALTWSCTQTQSNSNESSNEDGGNHFITIEAENTEVRPPFQVEAGEGASGEQYIWVPNYASAFRFSVDHGGRYKVWGRVFCTHGAEDSFNMQMDEADPFNWNNIPHSDTWAWDDVHDKTGARVFALDAGEHVLKLRSREDGSMMDKILITNDLDYKPEGNPEPTFKAQQGKEYIWIEAESGDIKPPFYVEPHHLASGKQHIEVPTQITRMKVNIPHEGTYRLIFRVKAAAGDQNSIKLRVGDEGEYSNWNAIPEDKFGQWVWDEVDLDSKTPGKTHFNLKKGTTNIWIKYREEGLMIDKVLITDEMEFVPEADGNV